VWMSFGILSYTKMDAIGATWGGHVAPRSQRPDEIAVAATRPSPAVRNRSLRLDPAWDAS